MPTASPKPCVLCRVLVRDGTSRCALHKLAAWVGRPEVKRTTGRKLQRQRAALFTREPLCRECAKHGLATPAVIRDHIAPLAEGGSDDDGNVQPLCRPCSDAKTAAESARGRRRGSVTAPTGGVSKSSPAAPETERLAGFSRG